MSCADNAANAAQDAKNNLEQQIDGLLGSGNAVGGLPSIIANKLSAKMHGTSHDPSMVDLGAVFGGTAAGMAAGQAIKNAAGNASASTYKGADAAYDLNEDYQRSREAGQNVDDAADQHGSASRGQCDPDNPPPGGGQGGGSSGGSPGGRGSGGGAGKPAGYDTPPRDPLVVDLNGGGIDLVSVQDSHAYFDLNNDGFAEKVGWIGHGTGLLALDANQNGKIDSGNELFGDATTDGFAELAQLDSNHNGIIESGDSQFASLKVWADEDGDGVTDSGELLSLAQAGILSISLNSVAQSSTLHGNFVARSGTFTRTNGEDAQAASVWFSVDQTDSRFVVPDDFQYSSDAAWLPDAKGYGQVADLAVAVTLDSALGTELRALVVDSMSLSASDFRVRVATLVGDWFDAQPAAAGTRGTFVNYEHLAIVEKWFGSAFWQTTVSTQNAAFIDETYDRLIDSISARLLAQIPTSWWALEVEASGEDVPLLGHSLSPFSVYYYDFETDELSGRMDYFVALALAQSPSGSAALASYLSRLSDYLSFAKSMIYEGDETAFFADIEEAVAFVNETSILDVVVSHGLANGISGGTAANDTLQALRSGAAVLGGDGADAISGVAGAEVLAGEAGNDTVIARGGADVVIGGIGNDTVSGDGGDDTYVFNRGDGQDVIKEWSATAGSGWGGNDTIQFAAGITAANLVVTQANSGNDLVIAIAGTTDKVTIQSGINGGSDYRVEQVKFSDGTTLTHAQLMALATTPTAAADTFYGDETTNSLSGGAGSDVLIARAGNDTLTGGLGNDTLSGDGNDDVYVFSRGDGQDVIKEWSATAASGWGGADTIQLGANITAANLVVTQANSGNDLVIAIAGTTDKITIQGGINGGSDYRIEQVRFSDGSRLTHAQLMALATTPTAGADTFYGDETANSLSGGAGNDTLIARNGNDTLTGGIGNDTLSGDGNDDVYVFARGDGQDVIKEWSATAGSGWGGNDTLQFGPNITAANLVVTQGNNGNDLVIGIAGTTDKVTIQNGINGGSDYRIDQVRLNDGAVLTHAQLLALSTAPTAGNDVFYGDENVNSVSGGAGIDTLSGRNGNDTLTGGVGNDIVSGDGGNDTYVFSRGDGQDVIKEWSATSNSGWGGNDTLQFGPNITAANLVVTQGNNGNDLVIAIAGTTDKVTIQGGINGGSDFRVEQVRLNDGTILTYAQLMALAATPTAGNDTFYGDENANSLSGGAGGDTLYGRSGNDVLTGGTGNDTISGDGGNDTFVFNRGDGQDVVKEWSATSNSGWGGADTLQFGPNITAANLVVTQGNNGNDLVIGIAGTADKVTIQNGINGGSDYRIEQARLNDGTVLSHAQLMERSTTPTTGNDVFYGDENANTLSGGAGNDTLDGRAGNDILIGGAGTDTLTGGSGFDTFSFVSAGEGGDLIQGFVAADDTFRFSAAGFGGGLVAGQNLVAGATFISNADPLASSSAGTFLYETDTRELSWDADGNGSGAEVLIATLASVTGALTVSDFAII